MGFLSAFKKRNPASSSSMSVTKDDGRYRQKLIDSGVLPDRIPVNATSTTLDCIGNLVSVFRDGETMETRNPNRYKLECEIEKFRAHRY